MVDGSVTYGSEIYGGVTIEGVIYGYVICWRSDCHSVIGEGVLLNQFIKNIKWKFHHHRPLQII